MRRPTQNRDSLETDSSVRRAHMHTRGNSRLDASLDARAVRVIYDYIRRETHSRFVRILMEISWHLTGIARHHRKRKIPAAAAAGFALSRPVRSRTAEFNVTGPARRNDGTKRRTVNPDSTLHTRSRCAPRRPRRCNGSAINAVAGRGGQTALPFLFSSDPRQNAVARDRDFNWPTHPVAYLFHVHSSAWSFISSLGTTVACQIDGAWSAHFLSPPALTLFFATAARDCASGRLENTAGLRIEITCNK